MLFALDTTLPFLGVSAKKPRNTFIERFGNEIHGYQHNQRPKSHHFQTATSNIMREDKISVD